MYPQTALSDQDKIWRNGDIVATKVVCETEDAILELRLHKWTRIKCYGGHYKSSRNRQCTAFPFPKSY